MADTSVAKFNLKEAQQHEDIAQLYKAGLSPKQILKKFPTYSEQDVLAILQENYSIANIDFSLLDGILLKGYLEDMAKVDETIIKQTKDFDTLLKAYLFKLNARNYAVKFRAIVKELRGSMPGQGDLPPGANPFSDSSPNFGSVQIVEQIKRYIKVLPPNKQHEAIELLEGIETESYQKLVEILRSSMPMAEGEFATIPEAARLLVQNDED